MVRARSNRPRPPLDADRLNELALAYVGRFATTRSKLASYLGRKLRERGWAGEGAPDIDAIVERLAGLGYVDDAAYALSKSRALTGRGYGARRVAQALRSAGIAEGDSSAANELAATEAVDAALRFAQRRRLGPFGERRDDPAAHERALGAMVRAGHSFGLARAILSLQSGDDVDIEMLAEKA